MNHRVLGVDLGIRAPSVAVVADTDGTIIGNAVRFVLQLGIDELVRVEVAALKDAKEGTKLHVYDPTHQWSLSPSGLAMVRSNSSWSKRIQRANTSQPFS